MIQLEGMSYIMFSLSLVPGKLVRVIKICLNDICSRARIGKHLSDIFPITDSLKQGDALAPLLYKFTLEYAIRTVWVN